MHNTGFRKEELTESMKGLRIFIKWRSQKWGREKSEINGRKPTDLGH
jgi:hypothetical protein